MRLLVNGSSVSVDQMGPNFLLVSNAIDHPPADAKLVLQVDENKREWRVHLPNGISSGCKRVIISTVAN